MKMKEKTKYYLVVDRGNGRSVNMVREVPDSKGGYDYLPLDKVEASKHVGTLLGSGVRTSLIEEACRGR